MITGVSYRRNGNGLEPIDIVKGGTVMAAAKKKPAEIETSIAESSKSVFDDISNPAHYTDKRKYEPRKVIMDWDLNFYLGNVVKYISRAGRKGDTLDDLKKAAQYLEWEIERLEEKEDE